MPDLIREPDNLRNRYRRCCHARKAYGWSRMTLREFKLQRPDSYSAGNYDRAQTFVELLRGLHPAAWKETT